MNEIQKIKLVIGVGIILFALFRYYSNSEMNEFTGIKQHISMTTVEVAALGFDPGTAQGTAAIATVINMKYGRRDELESDNPGVRFMMDAGYNPVEMIGVMKILKDSSGPDRTRARMSIHPGPENKIEKIKEVIIV